ncbi:unnamed protein product, partial [Ectocarpus sp. 6 AP-2014]
QRRTGSRYKGGLTAAGDWASGVQSGKPSAPPTSTAGRGEGTCASSRCLESSLKGESTPRGKVSVYWLVVPVGSSPTSLRHVFLRRFVLPRNRLLY